mgnify:CR=1 FL=1
MPQLAGMRTIAPWRVVEGQLSWLDEVGTALDEWIRVLGGNHGRDRWTRVGAAHPSGEPGFYTVDIRGSDLIADNADNLRLAGSDKGSVPGGVHVMEATVDGELLRVRVPEFADLPEPYVWRARQEPAFLIKALRNELGTLGDAGLANLLARGEPGGVLASTGPPPWPTEQQAAYQACLGRGLWLIWGPPGTGKTRVLRAAASDLIAAGKRVLLVSGTNIAVDNALQGVVAERHPASGEIVRVGPPQLREIAENRQVCLPLIVKARLADVEEQRRTVALELLGMRRREERLRDLEKKLDGFDSAVYEASVALLATPGHTLAEIDHALTQCDQLAAEGLKALEDARIELDVRMSAVAETTAARDLWAEADSKNAELAQVEDAATQAEGRALVVENECATAEEEITALRKPGGRVRWRDRAALRDVQHRVETLRPAAERLRATADEARSIATAFGQSTEAAVARLAAQAAFSRDEIQRRDSAAARVQALLYDTEQAQFATLDRLAKLHAARDKARSAEALVASCTARDWPRIPLRGHALTRRGRARQRLAPPSRGAARRTRAAVREAGS